MYTYELPTTGAISFSDFCVDQSVDKVYGRLIPEATQARANLRAVLKDGKRTDSEQRDYLNLVKIIEEYVPYLLSLLNCANHDEIGLKSEPSFSWRTTLTANLFNNSPRIDLPGLHADLAFTLLTYAFALSNLAQSNIDSVGGYETDRAISESERRAKDDRLNIAVDFICRASGIFAYIGETTLSEWETHRGSSPGFAKPPDVTREVVDALAKMALADAQTIAIRKLLSKSAYDSNVSPGPPLPTSHPAPALLAKLHIECASLYSSARSLVKTVGSTTPASKKGLRGNSQEVSSSSSSKEVSPDLRRYLSRQADLHSALSHKWLGVDAAEKGGPERGGEAVGFLEWAKKDLEELKDSKTFSLPGTTDKEAEDQWKTKLADEIRKTTLFYKYYKRINDTVHFQPVSPQKELQIRIPSGRIVMPAKPFVPPTPAFGPGSVEHQWRKIEQADIAKVPDAVSPSNNNGENDSSQEQEVFSPSPSTKATYAGAGAYF